MSLPLDSDSARNYGRKLYTVILLLWPPATAAWVGVWALNDSKPSAYLVYLQIQVAIIASVLLFAEGRGRDRPLLMVLGIIFTMVWLVDGIFALAGPLAEVPLWIERAGAQPS